MLYFLWWLNEVILLLRDCRPLPLGSTMQTFPLLLIHIESFTNVRDVTQTHRMLQHRMKFHDFYYVSDE